MMARRLIVALVAAIAISGVCTVWLNRKVAGMQKTEHHKRYVAAPQALQAGEILHASTLRFVDWPSDIPLIGAFMTPEQVDGRTLLYPIAGGEPILEQQLSAAGSGPGLSPKIPDGMRAISLKSDQVVGVAGFLLPGTHVDVLVTYHTAPSQDALTATVLQDVQILTAGQKMQPDPDGKPNSVDVVTLLVTPEDAEKVVLASTQGTVHFVLRNGSDHNHVTQDPAQLAEFGQLQKQRPTIVVHRAKTVVAATRPGYNVETIRGDKPSVETF